MKYSYEYEVAFAMKYAVRICVGFILLHILEVDKILHNLQGLFHIA